MCGLAGFFQPNGFYHGEGRNIVKKMAQTLIHRGPDDSGEWVDGNSGIALGHRRLSILDLSSSGHQPMVAHSGRYVLVFNGEIYNHLDMRKEIDSIANISWCGQSDTETLLAGFDQWGVGVALQKSVGMFAFALWDRETRTLTLARDRMGEKPLYYGWQGDVFIFGSELKALRVHPAFKNEIDPGVLPLFLKHGYIPAPFSVYQGIHKLLPGTFLEVSGADSWEGLPDPKSYWSLRDVASAGLAKPYGGGEQGIIDELEIRLKKAVSLQRIADVPLGAFLSGGIDSSLIVALMQAQSRQPVKTFTIGFHEKIYDESRHAEEIANYLGTDHTTFYVSLDEVVGVIPQIHELYDEPFSDSSASMLVARLAREEVKVSLSGDGGDEIFGGYSAYTMLNGLWEKFQLIPEILRPHVSKSILHIPSPILTTILSPLLKFLGRSTSIPPGLRIHQLSRGLQCHSSADFFRLMKTMGGIERTLLRDPGADLLWDHHGQTNSSFENFYHTMMFADTVEYLPDDILVKVDRASMSVGLETRAPLLDHRVVEFAWQLPANIKIRNGQGKWPLYQLLCRYVPKHLIDRPKMGFNLPTSEWIRGPLRGWAEDLLSEERLSSGIFFDANNVREIFQQHVAGQYNWQAILWRILAFQSFLNKK